MFVMLEGQAVNVRNIERITASYDAVNENYKVEAIAVFTTLSGEKYAKEFLIGTFSDYEEAVEEVKSYAKKLNKKLKGE